MRKQRKKPSARQGSPPKIRRSAPSSRKQQPLDPTVHASPFGSLSAALPRSILDSVRDLIVVLDGELRVVMVNEPFYKAFRTDAQHTEGRRFYELGNGQWNDPKLVSLLRDVLPRHSFFDDFEVTHNFEIIGRRTMVLNAREMSGADRQPMIVLSIQDVTERLQFQAHVQASELRLRRFFEAAPNGILILDHLTRKITEANPAISEKLGVPALEMIGKELWEIGILPSEQESHRFFRQLQDQGVVRMTDVRLTKDDGSRLVVDVVANLYVEVGRTLIQCHVTNRTERKRAEEQERTLIELIEQAPFGMYIVDSNFRISHMNLGSQNKAFRNVRPVLGRDLAEAMHILWPEAVAEDIIAKFRHTLETGEPYHSPGFTNPRKDIAGAVESYEWELQRIDLPDQQWGVVCYYFDSTTLREAEQALIDSEARFRTMADASPVIIWATDDTGGIQFINQAYRSYCGLTDDDVRAHRWHMVVHPDDREAYVADFMNCVREHTAFYSKCRIKRADGEWRWIASYGAPRFASHGQFLGHVGSSPDIHDLITAQEALKELNQNERRVKYAMDAAFGGIWDWNIQTGQVFFSKEWLESLGYQQEDVPAHVSFWESLVHPEDMPRVRETLQAHFEGRMPVYRCQNRLRRQDGTYRWNLDRGKVVEWDPGGKPLRMVGADIDITDVIQRRP